MSIKRRSLTRSPAHATTQTRGKAAQLLTTHSPHAEVSRTKISQNRNRGRSFGVYTRYGGGIMPGSYPSSQVNVNDYYIDAFIGVGVMGSLLLAAVGCALFHYCKNKRRGSSSPQGSQMGTTTTTVNSPLSRDDYEWEEFPPAAARLRLNEEYEDEDTNSGDELSYLTAASHGDEEPVRYCVIAVTHERNVVPENLDNRSNESLDQNAARHASPASGNDESQHYYTAENHLSAIGDDLESQTTGESFKTCDDDADDDDDRVYNTDSVRNEAATDVLELSPLTDRDGDVSDCLATLGLDIGSEENGDDDAEGVNNLSLSSQETDDDVVSSDDSLFSRIQDVKAQPEFSPYHLAWSTPCLSHRRRPVYRCHSETHSAAKKLNMDVAVGKLDGPGRAGADHEEHQRADKCKLLHSRQPERFDPSSGESTCSDSPVFGGGGWVGFPNPPEDAWRCRPVSVEYRTPRPPPFRRSAQTQSRRSVGALNLLAAADDEAPRPRRAERRQPLAYSVEAYRRSLKNLACAGAAAVAVVAGEASKASPRLELHPGSDSTSSSSSSPSCASSSYSLSPSANAYPASSLLSQNAVCGTPLPVASGLGVFPGPRNTEESEDPELIPSNPRAGVRRCNLNSTLADLGEIIHNNERSVAGVAAASTPMAGGGKRKAVKVVEDALNNNDDDDNAINTSDSSLLSPVGSWAPPSTPSPSWASSHGAAAASSAEKTSDVHDDKLWPGDTARSPSPPNITEASKAGKAFPAATVTMTLQATPTSRPPSLEPRLSGELDNSFFKTPYPVDNPRPTPSSSLRANKYSARPAIPRSRSSSNYKLLSSDALNLADAANMQLRPLRRSKTSESISRSTQNILLQPWPMSVGSWSDVSAAGSSASLLCLQDSSLVWDNEFSASGADTAAAEVNDSLAWEDDLYLK